MTMWHAEQKFSLMREMLIEWGKAHFRKFPWRLATDPYRILVSEFLLHRTRAEQVTPIYEELVQKYPDVRHLAEAEFSDVEKILKPAGLRWRVRNLYLTAQELVRRYGGTVPDRKEDLLSLPGISNYIAGAILCFAYGKPEPLLDTNTVRILGRLSGIPVTDSSRRSRKFERLMMRFLDKNRPKEFNYALLDLGALVCLKRSPPRCKECPLNECCSYHRDIGSIKSR